MRLPMDWGDIEIFLAIAREGTLGGAARLLNMSQPTMGRRIKKLEEMLGHALFQRTTDGFVLTDEGANVLVHATRMEEEALAMQRVLSGGAAQLDGILRISSSDWFGAHVLAPLIAGFNKSYPSVTIELLTASRLLSLPRREADLVFRIAAFDEADVVSRKAIDVQYGLYGADKLAGTVKEHGREGRLITMDAAFGAMPDMVWLNDLLPEAKIVARSNNRDVQARLCQMGLGMAVLPKLLAQSCGGLREIRLSSAPPSRITWIGYHRDMRRSPRLRAFIDYVVPELGRLVT